MNKIIRTILSAAFAIIVFFALQHLVVPKYMDDILEGSFIAEYYKEKSPHDVIIIGDCEVYENINPIVLWEHYGITSYIRGSAQQLIWQSYALLEETLKYETPKVVVYNVQSMVHNEPQREEYNRMTIDGMKWSKHKYESIRASMTAEEQFLDYLFPLLRYHSRITSLSQSDFKYYLNKSKVTHNGYYMRVDVIPFEEPLAEEKPADMQFGDNAYTYLDKLTALCKAHNIQLVLIKAPSLSPVWYDEYEKQIVDYAQKNNLHYINYLDLVDELGIDYASDTYDGGLHMNLSGAEKISMHLGKTLASSCGLEDHRKDITLSTVWREKVQFHDNMIKMQHEELEKYGHLVSFGSGGEETIQYDE